ncbi:hypothetical protein GWI33_014145 [Rhynchophorus ferrugineus]|uniref:Uncharacterized protein n=1 Tax=Rhynchophorus ferrugineus TaxID=354439 RepID=A0A834I7S5_RHYFE|nr:hypothetical protein GWI33_014145 [Rhynchophorus ferrugineus]
MEDALWKELQLQLGRASVSVLNEALLYFNNLMQRSEPEPPFTSLDDLVIYRQMLWMELHKRKFNPCLDEIRRSVPEHNAIDEPQVPTIRMVTITIVDPVPDPFNSTNDANEGSTNQASNDKSSTISLSISESEIPESKIDIDKMLLYMKFDYNLEKISAHRAMVRFNRTRRQMVEEWLLNFENFVQEIPPPPPQRKRSKSCSF